MWANSGRRGAIRLLSAGAVVAALLVCTQIALASPQSGLTYRPFTPATRPKPSNQPRYPGKAGTPSPWLTLTHAPPSGFIPGSMMVMTDGTVLIHEDNTGTWERLTPDSSGSYVNGTWSTVPSMPSGYSPLYYSSQILPTGQLLVEGGEYNGSGTEVWTNQGAIYSPASNSWTSVSPPSPWNNIGDAQSVMLPTATGSTWTGGTFMMAHPFADGSGNTGRDSALYNSNGTWTTIAGTGKLDRNDEEGWTLLPNDRVLTVDIEHNWDGTPGHTCSPCTSELFNPLTNTWSATGNVPVDLPSYVGPSGPSEEMGPVVARPDGTAFAVGGNDATASYDSATGTWTAGPTLANNQDSADGAGSILPDGNVLFDASPGVFSAPTHFFVWNGSTITQVADTANAPSDSSYVTRFVVLPTGQVMFTDGTGDIEIYNSDLTFNTSWEPTIASIQSTALKPGSTYGLSGTQLSGRSEGAAYGDDNQSATNYPLVRITNNASHVVTYARTTGFSYAIASGAQSATNFTVPASTPTGASTLQVVANGIPSAAQAVTITTASLAVSPSTLAAPDSVTVSWSGVNAPTSHDWIGVYHPGDANNAPLAKIYDDSCTPTAGTTALASGSCMFTVPGLGNIAGTYELRLFSNDSFTLLATSNLVTVNQGATVTVNPLSLHAGSPVTVSWSAVSAPTSHDWVGVYHPGDPNSTPLGRFYDDSCGPTAGTTALASGSCPFTVPNLSNIAGTYQLRLFSNDSFTLLATSGTVTVGPGSAPQARPSANRTARLLPLGGGRTHRRPGSR